MFFKDRVSYWGMLTITWFMMLLTFPFMYVSCKANHDKTSCEKMCYPSEVAKQKSHDCVCQPIIKDK